MKLLPFESYAIEAASPPAELAERLQSRTDRPRFAARQDPDADFIGWVTSDGFRIRPVIRSGMAFAPEVFGRFVRNPDGTRVEIEMIPSSATLAIIAVLTGAIGMMVFYSGPRVYLAIAGEILTSWLFSIAGFWLDAGTSRRKLLELLEIDAHLSRHQEGS